MAGLSQQPEVPHCSPRSCTIDSPDSFVSYITSIAGSCGSQSSQISSGLRGDLSGPLAPIAGAGGTGSLSSLLGSDVSRKSLVRDGRLGGGKASVAAAARQLFPVDRPALEAWLTQAERLQVCKAVGHVQQHFS
jgi:hypothetical protein